MTVKKLLYIIQTGVLRLKNEYFTSGKDLKNDGYIRGRNSKKKQQRGLIHPSLLL
jgi:hypothetical protein